MMCAIARRVRSSSASQAASNVSGPKRSQISTIRRSAARQPPMIAIRSLRFVSGVRVLLRITSSAVSLRTPWSKILIGGIRMPSSQIESASETWLPGTLPPTSIMWPKSEANATRSPSWKTGRITSQSLQWEIDPLQRYGSFSRITSPSEISPPKRSITSGMYEPNWPTTIWPRALQIIGNSSCCTRIVGDMAARRTTSSISKRALRSAFSIRSSVATSIVVLIGDASSGRIRRFIQGSTTAWCPGSTTVVASYCSTIA